MRSLEARAIISAQDKTGNVFERIAGKVRHLEAASGRANRMSAAVARSGASTLAMVGRFAAPAALAAGAVAASRNFAAFDRQLTYLGNTAEASGEQMASVRKEIGATSRFVAESPEEVLRATNAYVTAGQDLTTAAKATRETAITAKAYGADMEETARAGTAVLQNLNIEVGKLGRAFDIMAEGAKVGQFEFRDMAREMPAVAAAAQALGMTGEKALGEIVGGLEIVRTATGDSSTAANDYYNLLQKITAKETRDRFKKLGIDIETEIKKGTAHGESAMMTFLRVVQRATGGDPFKIKNLVVDMQANRALTALISKFGDLEGVIARVMAASGARMNAFGNVMADQQAGLDKLSQAWDRLLKIVGKNTGLNAAAGALADGVNAGLDVGEMSPQERENFAEMSRRKFNAGTTAADLRAQEEADRSRAEEIPALIARLRGGHVRGKDARIAALEAELQRLQGGGSPALQARRWDAAVAGLNVSAMDEPPMPPPGYAPLPPPAPLPPRNPRRKYRLQRGAEAPLPEASPLRVPAMMAPDDVGAVRGGAIKAVVEGPIPVQASVTGQAEVTVRLHVDASPELRALAADAVRARLPLRAADTGRGMVEAEPHAPTGRSMPGATPWRGTSGSGL